MIFLKILVVAEKFDGKRLLSFLQNEFKYTSKNTFYKALRKKDIRVNNIKISEDIIIHTGDEVKIFILDKYLFPFLDDIKIVYEDENILIVNKPKGIEITGNNSLTCFLQNKFSSSDIMPCHRLDRNTSGIIIFARTPLSLNILLEKFRNHEIIKLYKCKVNGILNKESDILKAYLFKDSNKSLVYISDFYKKGYVEIITEYKVLEQNFLR